MATVDVIMPLYKGRRWVAETISMLREQTHTDWRLVAVDDACPERTGDLVPELAPDAQMIRLSRNRGAAHARNVAVRHSTAPFVALLDQDDLWHPTKLEKQLAALGDHADAGACGTDAMLIDEHGAAVAEADSNRKRQLNWEEAPLAELLRAQYLSNRVKTASSVIRREAWEDLGGQIENRPGAEDWAFWFQMLQRGWRVVQVLEPLHYWRQHAGNESKSTSRDLVRYGMQLQYGVRYGRQLGLPTLARAANKAVKRSG